MLMLVPATDPYRNWPIVDSSGMIFVPSRGLVVVGAGVGLAQPVGLIRRLSTNLFA